MSITKKNYITDVQADPLQPLDYRIKYSPIKKAGALISLKLLEQKCDPKDAAKTIKIAIAAHEIFKGYTKKITGFWARICYGIRKLFGLHKKLDAKNKGVADIYQKILMSARTCYQRQDLAAEDSLKFFLPTPAPIPESVPVSQPLSTPTHPPISTAESIIEALAASNSNNRPEPQQVATVVNKLEALINAPIMQEKILEKRRTFNEMAFTKLLEELEKNPVIPPSFLQAFRASWNAPESDDQIIPLKIKQHKQLFSRALRQEILVAAKKAAKEFDKEKITESLENLRKNILQDLNSGRIIPAEKVIQDRYKGFFDLLRKASEGEIFSEQEQILWKEKYNEIVNHAYLHYEVTKKRKNTSLTPATGSKIENLLLELLGRGKESDPIEKKKRNLVNLQVIETLMGGQGLDKISIEELKLHIAKEQRLARLQGPGIPKAERAAQVIDALEEKRQALRRQAEPFAKEIITLDPNCPPKGKKFLLKGKEKTFKRKINRAIYERMKRATTLEEIKNYLSGNSENLAATIDKFNKISLEKISIDFDNNPRHFLFYNKWGSQFLLELIQGSEDANEALGEGVCCAITSRWIQNELKNTKNTIDTDFIRNCQLDQILPEDRIAQSLFQSSTELPKIYLGNISVPSDHLQQYNEIKFPKKFRNRFNFAPLTQLPIRITPEGIKEKNNYNISEKQRLHAMWKNLFQKHLENLPSNQKILNVILSLRDVGHAIYVRYDVTNGIFRIGDPNYGIIEITGNSIDEKKNYFLECFADLMMEYNPKSCSFLNWELQK